MFFEGKGAKQRSTHPIELRYIDSEWQVKLPNDYGGISTGIEFLCLWVQLGLHAITTGFPH